VAGNSRWNASASVCTAIWAAIFAIVVATHAVGDDHQQGIA
jgi:hypothetical protein